MAIVLESDSTNLDQSAKLIKSVEEKNVKMKYTTKYAKECEIVDKWDFT